MPLEFLASSLLDRGDVLARRGVNIDDVVEVVREVHELTRPIDRHAPGLQDKVMICLKEPNRLGLWRCTLQSHSLVSERH